MLKNTQNKIMKYKLAPKTWEFFFQDKQYFNGIFSKLKIYAKKNP